MISDVRMGKSLSLIGNLLPNSRNCRTRAATVVSSASTRSERLAPSGAGAGLGAGAADGLGAADGGADGAGFGPGHWWKSRRLSESQGYGLPAFDLCQTIG